MPYQATAPSEGVRCFAEIPSRGILRAQSASDLVAGCGLCFAGALGPLDGRALVDFIQKATAGERSHARSWGFAGMGHRCIETGQAQLGDQAFIP